MVDSADYAFRSVTYAEQTLLRNVSFVMKAGIVYKQPAWQITLVLPGVIINGNKKTLPPIVFVRQELEGRFKLN